ncbi:hypothetical protein [Pseudomonas putida]|uniref:Uncharacterized protein n=1 Tax=Pseudomonas putida TaxID=303 RepID=A0A8I1EC77_PSEPU|nr:hypothetical protein [Pseudomonas putida]MBI6882613.1 hypothetical protein [Pseudomonas putida]
MFNYAIRIQADNDKVIGSCVDLPELKIVGNSAEEVQDIGPAEIYAAFNKRVANRMPIPLAREPEEGDIIVRLSALAIAKATLWRRMIELGMRKFDLYTKLSVAPVQVDRLLDFTYQSKIQSLEEALAALETGIRVSAIDMQWIELAYGGFYAQRLVDAYVAAGVTEMPIGKTKGGLATVKPYSLDYIIRTRYARQPDTMQTTDAVIDSLLASGHFRRSQMIDPKTSIPVDSIALV